MSLMLSFENSLILTTYLSSISRCVKSQPLYCLRKFTLTTRISGNLKEPWKKLANVTEKLSSSVCTFRLTALSHDTLKKRSESSFPNLNRTHSWSASLPCWNCREICRSDYFWICVNLRPESRNCMSAPFSTLRAP